MKLSFWDILASMVMLAGLALATIFINIFINPYSFINPFPPPTPVASLQVPTMTPSQRSLPELWTATPETPGVPSITGTRSTATITVTGTRLILPSKTPTRTRTASPSPSRSVTNTPNRTLTTYYYRTSTSTATSTTSDTTAPTNPGTPVTASATTVSTPYWTWTASTDAGGLDYYQIIWGTTSNCEGTYYYSYSNSWTAPAITSNTTYYICVRAKDDADNVSSWVGPSGFFYSGSAAPSALTRPASGITSTAAVLNGTVNPSNYATTVTFEYGTTAAYGSTATAVQSPLPIGTAAVDVNSAVISGLTANTLYHFRVVAVNSVGTTNSSDATFTTLKTGTTTVINSVLPEPTTVGASYTVTATVTGSGGTPGGTVSVSDGTDGCTITLAAGTGNCSMISTTVGSPKTITATYSGDTVFQTSSGTATHNVNKATPTITTWPSASAITYGQTLAASSLTGGVANPAGTFAFTTPATAPAVGLGTYTANVTFTPTDAANYNTVAGTVSVTVNKAASVITFGTAPTPTYLGGNFTVTATTTNTDDTAITFTTATTPPCALVGGAVFSSSAAGLCTVQAAGAAETANFLATTPVTQDITIAKAAATISFGAAPTPTFATGGSFTVTATSTNLDNNTVTFSVDSGPCSTAGSGTINYTGAGTCVIRASGVGETANYLAAAAMTQDVDIAMAGTTTSIDSDVPDGSASGAAIAVTVSVTSAGGTPTGTVAVSGSGASCSITLAGGTGSCNLTPTVAGPYPVTFVITADYNSDGNFDASSDTENHDITS